MTTITVYDPPMCCSTGICGAEVDSQLVQFAGDLDWLKTRGIEVFRVNLSQEPQRFVEQVTVKDVLERAGNEGLPIIMVDDKLVASGRYPGFSELAGFAGIKTAPVSGKPASEEEKATTSSGTCCGSANPSQQKTSGCC